MWRTCAVEAGHERALTAVVGTVTGGKERRHLPDFFLVGGDGLVTVVNVKPADGRAGPKVAEALGWAGAVFAERGWHQEIWTGASPVRVATCGSLPAIATPLASTRNSSGGGRNDSRAVAVGPAQGPCADEAKTSGEEAEHGRPEPKTARARGPFRGLRAPSPR